jgi:hypothetical protein
MVVVAQFEPLPKWWQWLNFDIGSSSLNLPLPQPCRQSSELLILPPRWTVDFPQIVHCSPEN